MSSSAWLSQWIEKSIDRKLGSIFLAGLLLAALLILLLWVYL